MYKIIFIGGINRSGGSLLARLFDGHDKIASYPLELTFPHDNSYYSIFENYAGIPITVPTDYNGDEESFNPFFYGSGEARSPFPNIDINNFGKPKDIYNLLDIPKYQPKVPLKWGKEKSDPVGVRRNYLEKVFYGKVKTDFNFINFIKSFEEYKKEAKTVAQLYDARNKAYFSSWDEANNIEHINFVVMQSSGGLYVTNIQSFFNEFKGSTFIFPVRDIMGYIASEKTRLARRYYGTRRFARPRLPNYLVKIFDVYDLDSKIRGWMSAVTRGVVLQEYFGVNNNFIVYTHENLLNNSEKTMRVLSKYIGIKFDSILLEPTIGGHPWKGNSHQGPRKDISKDLSSYYPKVLRKDEIEQIENIAGGIRSFLKNSDSTPTILTEIPKDCLIDYKYQKKYFADTEKIVLYSALVNTGGRRVMVRTPSFIAIIAYLISKFVRIYHIPRMLKLRFFPGVGKQNYT